MKRPTKVAQLQLRVSAEEKSAIRRGARRAGMDMSAYVLSRVLPAASASFQRAIAALSGPGAPSFALAEINSLLSPLTAPELRQAVAMAPEVTLAPFLANYVAAMVETACERRAIPVPAWTRSIEPLAEPVFGSSLASLRLHLLTHAPPAFRQRNIFVDASVGEQV
ncbi:MAG: plasmid mobilization protein [Steroidobacteraceae bacterium]